MRRLVLFSVATLLLTSGLARAQAASDCAALAILRIEGSDLLEWTHPLCPYSRVARYRGTGDRNDAASFACVEPIVPRAPRR